MVDGVIGPQTSAALRGAASSFSSASATGSSTSGTAMLQSRLGIPADGVYGPQTRAAVRSYQQAHGLVVDGVAGPQTIASLGLPAGTVIRVPAATSESSTVSGTSTTASTGSGSLAAVAAARAQVGKPYVFAGVGPSGFDCSGLTQFAMRQAGISLPRTSYSQFAVGSAVSSSAIQAGDLVFWNTGGGGASHVGIATSATTVISATTHGVMEHAIFGSYWGAHYVGARRIG
jgi:cell wall-associated NlpC family hydrolase